MITPPCAGLLHTATIHAEPFAAQVSAVAPEARQLHVVDAELLATAIRTGVTPDLTAAVARHVEHLIASGATAVLVTCSSIAETVESAAAHTEVPVLRVDEPMAREAAAIAGAGGRITVLATLRSTLAPTTKLIRRYAEEAEISTEVVTGAADARVAGDQAEHDQLIGKAIAAAQADVVVVLAQATMAAAATGTGVQVLTSPESGVAALAEALGRS